MESEIQIFKHEKLGELRVAGTAEKPMFCLSDVCKSLELGNVTALKSRLDDKGFSQIKVLTNGGCQQMFFVNEPNLYRCIFRSDKEKAKVFQDWVFNEVLPSIRKNGGYLTPQKVDEILSDPDTIIRLATNLKEERKKRLEAEKKVLENKPKVAFADAITSSSSSCLIGELAKLIKQAVERRGGKISIGQNRFYQWLRDNGYLGKGYGYYNVANQEYVERGLFELKKSVHDENGVMVSKTTTKVTGNGQSYFVNGFLDGKFSISQP